MSESDGESPVPFQMKRFYKVGIALAAVLAILFIPTIRMTLMCYVDSESHPAGLPPAAIPETHFLSLTHYLIYLANGEYLVFDRNVPQRGGGEVLLTIICEPEHKLSL